MIPHYHLNDALGLLKLVVNEFKLVLKIKYGESMNRQLHKVKQHTEILSNYVLMRADEETARRLINKQILERRK